MKKILTILLTLLGLPCMAYQNYMLMADKVISDVKITNNDVLSIEEFKNYNTENKMILIIPKNIGTSKISFCKGNKKICLKVKIKEDKTYINMVNGIKLVPIDIPQELK